MKKLTLFMVFAFTLFFSNQVNAQTYVDTYAIDENFNAGTLGTWGFVASGSGTVFTNPVGNLNVLFQSPAGTATKTLSSTVLPGDDSKMYFEFDWNVGTPGRTSNTAVLFFRDASGRKIFGMLGYRLTGNSLRLLNLNTAYTNYDDTSIRFGTFALSANIHISAVIDFATKKIVTITASLVGTPTTNFTATNLDFLNSEATNLSDMHIEWSRGGSGNHNYLFDNFQIYTKKLSAGKADVTVHYLDTEGAQIKDNRIAEGQDVGLFYEATSDDKNSFKTVTNYYVYNPEATAAAAGVGTGDSVLVKNAGSHIYLRFTKFDLVNGTYTWTGLTSSNWNETENNFTTNGINNIAFQKDNPQLFDNSSSEKTVVLSSKLNIGSSEIEVASDGYSFTGAGILDGTGTLNVNPGSEGSTSINIINGITGGIKVSSGTANILNDASAVKYTILDNATLKVNTGLPFSKPITGTGIINIDATSNNSYLMDITNASTVNILLQNVGAISGTNWSDYFGGTFPAGSTINVTPKSGIIAGFAVSDAVISNTNVNINNDVRLFRYTNQGASGGGTSTVLIGNLNGTSGSTLEGGIVDASNRILAYNIGVLGGDATFDGVIKNYGTVTTAPLYIYKKGLGTWTLNGTSTYYPGLFNVDEGTVILNGALTSNVVPVTVAPGATLKGNGTVGGVTTVNGTLEGSLNFLSSLSLNGTTKFVVNGSNEGEYDVIDVAGAVTLGGTVDVTFSEPAGVKGINKAKNAPPIGTTIKLINASNIITSLPTIHYPASGWTFKPATGELIYDPNNVVSGIAGGEVEFRIYPTLTRDVINVEGNVKTIDVFSLTGQKVNSLVANGTKTVINMSNLSAGAYIIRANMEDGSANMQNVILQK